jgi:hypothetical protein
MKTQDIYDFLYTVLYGENTDSLNTLDPSLSAEELEARYRKFCVCPGFSEAFDQDVAFLVTGDERDENKRFIWLDRSTDTVKEIKLPIGTYENVVNAFVT